jgi:hypothetical protein
MGLGNSFEHGCSRSAVRDRGASALRSRGNRRFNRDEVVAVCRNAEQV